MNKSNDELQAGFKVLMQRKQQEVDMGKVKEIRDINSNATDKWHANYHNMRCMQFTYLQQSNNKEKYYIIERWERIDITGNISAKGLKAGDVEYRITYYIVSRKPNTKKEGQWIFGQYSPMIAHIDLMKLIEKAKKEGTIIDS